MFSACVSLPSLQFLFVRDSHTRVCLQECFDSLLSILQWSWTTLVLGVEELRGLKGFQYTATLLDLERLRFVGTCCLRLLRVYICEIFPIAGQSEETPHRRVLRTLG